MGGRKREIRAGHAASQRFRVVPVWKETIDRTALARALALLAIHLEQQDRADAQADRRDSELDRREEDHDGQDS